MLYKILAQIDIKVDELNIPHPSDGIEGGLPAALRIVFALAGGIAVLIITYAGIQFMLSRGNPEKSTAARNTVIYAAIGLAIAALAFNIVGFVAERV